MKTVYVIKGSEDGVIGVASNIKAAYRVALEYAECHNPSVVVPYHKVTKMLKTNNWDGYEVSVTDSALSFGDATIMIQTMVSK